MRACEHLYNQTSQGPNIRFSGVAGLFDDFGCHPEDASLEGGAVDVSLLRLEDSARFDAFGDAEIGDFDDAFVVDKDVGALDVAVDNILAVEVGEAREDLADEVADEGFLEGAIGSEHGGDGAARDVFQEDVEVLVVRVGAEVLHNVLMLEVTEKVDLAFQSGDHGFFAFVDDAVGGGGDFDLFDGHELTGEGVQGEEDGAEGALADEGALHPFDVFPLVAFEELVEFFVGFFAVGLDGGGELVVEGAAGFGCGAAASGFVEVAIDGCVRSVGVVGVPCLGVAVERDV